MNLDLAAPCLFTSAAGVPVYDLGYSLNTTPTSSLLINTADSCASTTIQPNTNQALVNTAVITGCGGRSSLLPGHELSVRGG